MAISFVILVRFVIPVTVILVVHCTAIPFFQASVSLFSQTADTMIENAGAFVFQSDAVLSFKDSTHRLARMTESLETRMSLDSRTNIDVGGGQMCIRVTQPRTDLV